MTKINPIFAAFSFTTLRQARAAFARLDGRGGQANKMKGLSVWTSNPGTPIVVILGEDQERVDSAAEIVMAAPGCQGNYILSDMMLRFFRNRRYSTAVRELRERGGPPTERP